MSGSRPATPGEGLCKMEPMLVRKGRVIWALLFVLLAMPLANAESIPKTSGILEQLETEFKKLADEIRPKVVSINPYISSTSKLNNRFGSSGPRPTNTGTGVIIDGRNGFIVTNSHVVKNFEQLEVTLLGGEKFIARVIGMDEETDLAVIKIDVKEALPEAKLADSSQLKVGQLAFAVGSPFGLKDTLTFGIVSGLNRENVNISKYEDFIQTDASINPGNSGGPLVNVRGEIIGINTAIINYAQSIGFSIPSNVVKNVVQHLIRDGEVKRGWLGVGIEPLTNEIAEEAQIKEGGVFVNAVFEGDPAHRAGIKVGDIILRVGNFKVTSPNKMIRIIGAVSPGQKVDLDILREGKIQTISVELNIQQRNRELIAALPTERDPFLGVRVKDFAEHKDDFLKDVPEGVVVSEIVPESVAGKNGLRVGDRITAVNGHSVSSKEEFEHAIKGTRQGQKVFMLLTRSGESMHLEIEY